MFRLYQRLRIAGRRVFRLDDTPERIARGASCGLFCCTLPIVGQTLVGAVLAKLGRGNVVAAIAFSWVSNPATTLPIWYGCYRIGAAITRHESVTIATLTDLVDRCHRNGVMTTVHAGGALIEAVLVPLVIGALITGILLGALGYVAIKPLIHRLQQRRRAVARRWQTAAALKNT